MCIFSSLNHEVGIWFQLKTGQQSVADAAAHCRGVCNQLIMSDIKYVHQFAKSLTFHVENGLKMQFYSKDSDNYEFLLCFHLKCRIKYFDFYIDISIINR